MLDNLHRVRLWGSVHTVTPSEVLTSEMSINSDLLSLLAALAISVGFCLIMVVLDPIFNMGRDAA